VCVLDFELLLYRSNKDTHLGRCVSLILSYSWGEVGSRWGDVGQVLFEKVELLSSEYGTIKTVRALPRAIFHVATLESCSVFARHRLCLKSRRSSPPQARLEVHILLNHTSLGLRAIKHFWISIRFIHSYTRTHTRKRREGGFSFQLVGFPKEPVQRDLDSYMTVVSDSHYQSTLDAVYI